MAEPAATVVDIAPSRGWRGLDLAELMAFREVLYILVWRDLKVRYRQTMLGALWVMGQPLLTMVAFTLVFNRLARIDVEGMPYSVYVLAGLLPWTFFAASIQACANSLLANASLITKVYFPRLLVPFSSVVSSLLDFAVSGIVLAGMLAWYRIVPSAAIVFLPVVIAIGATLALGLGVWLAALNVKYRDIRVIIPFAMQFWMFATPVAYPLALVPERWRPLMQLNPAAGLVEGFRWCLFGGSAPVLALLCTLLAGVLLLATGIAFFRRTEPSFVDVI